MMLIKLGCFLLSLYTFCHLLFVLCLYRPPYRTAITSFPFSKYSKHFTWSGFMQKEGKLHRFRANPRRLITDKLSRDSAILLENYFTRSSHRNLLHPEFSGVWNHVTSRCQGLFPPLPISMGKALGTRLSSFHLALSRPPFCSCTWYCGRDFLQQMRKKCRQLQLL